MKRDERDLLHVLKEELAFLDSGGYTRTGKAWRPALLMEDSALCLNHGDAFRSRPCAECILSRLARREKRDVAGSCRHIPLNASGETLDLLYRYATELEIQETYRQWLIDMIRKLESERGPSLYVAAT
jgi:hypothetical protein